MPEETAGLHDRPLDGEGAVQGPGRCGTSFRMPARGGFAGVKSFSSGLNPERTRHDIVSGLRFGVLASSLREQPVERRLTAVLAADIVGYSRLMEQDEAG